MQIGVEQRGPWTVIGLNGELDGEASPSVYLRFQRELVHGRNHVLFDLSQVGFVDSKGLGMLVRCFKDARSRGGDVGLQRVPAPIERVLEFTRLDSIFAICGDDPPPVHGSDIEAA
jgi:anti-anti-sigma factor